MIIGVCVKVIKLKIWNLGVTHTLSHSQEGNLK